MKRLVIGVMPQEKIRERFLAIAKGALKPKSTDPKIWFPSIKSVAEVLSDENRALLKLIMSQKPASITSLATISGRKTSNLSRTLKTMSSYGIVEMVKENNHIRPIARATEFDIRA